MKKINTQEVWEDVRYHRHRIWINSLGAVPLAIREFLIFWNKASERRKISLIWQINKISLLGGIILLCVYVCGCIFFWTWTILLWTGITHLLLSVVGTIWCFVWTRMLSIHGDGNTKLD